MKVFTVNLYDYFGIEKPENSAGNLTCYITNRAEEYGANRLRPAMLVIPGGAYAYCSAREAEPVALKFLTQGYCSFVLDYSPSPFRYPTQHREAGMAMAYIRKEAENFGIRTDNVCAIGFSAGGHLCGCLATMYDSPVLDILGEDKSLVKPDACALMYPVVIYGEKGHNWSFNNICGDDEELKNSISLEKCVTEKSVPAYIFSTVGDKAVPCKNSLALACAYEDKGVPFSLHIYEKGSHGLSVNDITSDKASVLATRLPGTAEDYNQWVGQVTNWLKERGFEVLDNE